MVRVLFLSSNLGTLSENEYYLFSASISGTSVKYVLEQDKAAFIRLTGISILQSAANSFVSPTLRCAYSSRSYPLPLFLPLKIDAYELIGAPHNGIPTL